MRHGQRREADEDELQEPLVEGARPGRRGQHTQGDEQGAGRRGDHDRDGGPPRERAAFIPEAFAKVARRVQQTEVDDEEHERRRRKGEKCGDHTRCGVHAESSFTRVVGAGHGLDSHNGHPQVQLDDR